MNPENPLDQLHREQVQREVENERRKRLTGQVEGTPTNEIVDMLMKRDQRIREQDQKQAQLEQRIEELERVAETDPLTGLSNRRRFERDLETALKILADQQEHLHSRETDRLPDNYDLIIGDLDGFKGVNDTLGHNMGDEVLKNVAEKLPKLLRPGDSVARWGGDEFAILLKNSNNPEIPRDRIADNLPKLLAPMFGGEERIGISLGIVRIRSNMTREQIIEEADKKMYEIKRVRKEAQKTSRSEDNQG